MLLDRTDYINKLQDILNDSTKFQELPDDPTASRESKLQRYLYNLKRKGIFDQHTYDNIRPSGSQPSRLYGLPKTHKAYVPLRPIVSCIGSYSYNLAKFLVNMLRPINTGKYCVKDSFTFAKSINGLTNAKFMASLDVSSLFTNVPLQETIDICAQKLFHSNQVVCNLNKQQFCKLMSFAVQQNHFLFNGKIYDQIDGVAMGSPLGPVLANIFMSHLEDKCFENLPSKNPCIYYRYVDDTFAIFESRNEMHDFFKHINSLHPNISFTKEEEQNNSLPFLDVLVTR